MSKKHLGVFDSGIGGLTVLKSLRESMPDENIIYFGDTAHLPYGARTKEEITELVLNVVKFLNGFDIKALVIACNTADCAARKEVERLCDVPVFGIIESAAKVAAEASENGIIGVIATGATVDSGEYEKNIRRFKPDAQIISLACPKIVPLVESGHFQKGDEEIESVMRKYLIPLKKQGIDTLVLGCTHYPLLYDIIADILPDVKIISSSAAEAAAVKTALEKRNLINTEHGGEVKFYVSGSADSFEKNAGILIGADIKAEHVDV